MTSSERNRQLDWEAWKANPQTEQFFQYLKDRADSLEEQWVETLKAGQGGLDTIEENAYFAAHYQTLIDLQELGLPDIDNFYVPEEEEEYDEE